MWKKVITTLLLALLLLTFSSARRSNPKNVPTLMSVHLVDRNGFAETVTNRERLKQFQATDFFQSQPYQKTLRIYTRDVKGNVRSYANSYHPNGNVKQYIEILNGRAHGTYKEWHENGQQSVSAHVIGGMPDLTPAAESSWLFDGLSEAWDDNGNLVAQIHYAQGVLEGTSLYYHPSGQLWKSIPYQKGEANGTAEIFKKNGELLQQITFCQGKKEGKATRFWSQEQMASLEDYTAGKLLHGQYFDKSGVLLAEVKDGMGLRAVFGEERVKELQEIQEGILEGQVQVFNEAGELLRLYHVHDKIKDGVETEYYSPSKTKIKAPSTSNEPQPRLSFIWHEGKIQGVVRTWYASGVMESQKEMSHNKKHGMSTVWYQDGSLMMIEEYEQGKLIRGDYFSKEDKLPVSQIIQGKGTAMLFDPQGRMLQKIPYLNGKPDAH